MENHIEQMSNEADPSNDQIREEMLVDRARRLMSECNWSVGQCASDWNEKYARGRTDADFGALIGLTGDQVYQRRRVWERFDELYSTRMLLSWSHYYAALTWDDAAAALGWAEEAKATVKEMQAWRRLQRGEALNVPPETPPVNVVTDAIQLPEPVPVKAAEPIPVRPEPAPAAARATPGEPQIAGPGADDSAARATPADSGEQVEQVLHKMTSGLERIRAAMTAAMARDFRKAPKDVRLKFLQAAEKVGQIARTWG